MEHKENEGWDFSAGAGEDINVSLLSRLKKPQGKIDVVLDTDTYNEIDDQFALAFLIKSDEKLCLKGIYAAPFYNQNSTSPAEGMEKSYNEIFNILSLMKRDDLKPLVKEVQQDICRVKQNMLILKLQGILLNLRCSILPITRYMLLVSALLQI